MKKIKFHLRRGFNLILTLLSVVALFTLIMFLIYRPTYKISFKGKFIGYSRDVFNIKAKIHESIANGDEEAAYYEIDEEPVYEFTFMKAQFVPDDQKIIADIKADATPIYKTYAVKEKDKITARVATYKEASTILNELKKKDSDNLNDISIELKYEKEKPKLKESKKVVADLYKEKPAYPIYSYMPSRNYAFISRGRPSMARISLPISLQVPVYGIISANFGDGFAQDYEGPFHYGLDIAGNGGRTFKAAAAGTVESAGWGGEDYGNMVVINHGNGVKTLYAHASSLKVDKGDKVEAGQGIGVVGSTGFSTGPHLHFEVRYNEMVLNPRHHINI